MLSLAVLFEKRNLQRGKVNAQIGFVSMNGFSPLSLEVHFLNLGWASAAIFGLGERRGHKVLTNRMEKSDIGGTTFFGLVSIKTASACTEINHFIFSGSLQSSAHPNLHGYIPRLRWKN